MTTPAFKEWLVIVEALLAGEQALILRKGGIAEAGGGFTVDAGRFWLFPTRFHAQAEKTKPDAARFALPPAGPAAATVVVRAYADVVKSVFLTRWEQAAALDPFHFWTEATVRERFDWGSTPGLHAIVVRVHRLDRPVTLEVTPSMGGCTSWIELPLDFTVHPATHVLDDPAFARRRQALGL